MTRCQTTQPVGPHAEPPNDAAPQLNAGRMVRFGPFHIYRRILVSCPSGAYGTLAGMVLEVTLIDVLPGRSDEFVAAYQVARPMLAGAPGCRRWPIL